MTTPVRILFLHPTYTFGGAERTAYNLLANLDRQRFRITLVTSRRIAEHFADIALEKVVFVEDLGIDVWFRPVTFANLNKLRKDVNVIKTLVLKESPDIAFGMMYYASALLAIAKKWHALRVKVISSPRGPLNAYLVTFYAGNGADRLFWKLSFFYFFNLEILRFRMKAFVLDPLHRKMGQSDLDLLEGESRHQHLLKFGLDQLHSIIGKA